MAYTSFLPLCLGFLLFFGGCLAQFETDQRFKWETIGKQQQQQHRLRARTQCNIQSLNAQEPNRRDEAEAGTIEFWESNNEQFECAGVEAAKRTIQPRGLLLPYYTNTPELVYIIQGRGILGTIAPGCPETYESQTDITNPGQRIRDRHQKLQRFREGDILALPAGIARWAYNDGDSPIISVSLMDTGNDMNQLDENYRKFFIAGNPQKQSRQPEHGSQDTRSHHQQTGNIFSGFDEELLADVFNTDTEIARRLRGQDDQRGPIVRAERLEISLPEEQEEEWREREGEKRPNGLEETICTAKIRQNIGNPVRAEIYNPRGGRISTTNSHTLPILNWLQLSAERGFLYNNAIMTPRWIMNGHSIMYVIRGSAQIQVVGNNGKSMFHGEIRQGQLIIVPQNFAMIKKAGNNGMEWVAFRTTDNAVTSNLAGRLSVIRAMPEDVIANSYDISREEARDLKYNRDEVSVLSPGRISTEA